MIIEEYLYRYEEIQYHPGVDEYDRQLQGDGRVELFLSKLKILKITPKGVWVKYGIGKKFVNLNARKKYACINKKEALISFIMRKQKQIEILNSQLRKVNLALDLGIKMADKEYNLEVHRYVIKNKR